MIATLITSADFFGSGQYYNTYTFEKNKAHPGFRSINNPVIDKTVQLPKPQILSMGTPGMLIRYSVNDNITHNFPDILPAPGHAS